MAPKVSDWTEEKWMLAHRFPSPSFQLTAAQGQNKSLRDVFMVNSEPVMDSYSKFYDAVI